MTELTHEQQLAVSNAYRLWESRCESLAEDMKFELELRFDLDDGALDEEWDKQA